MGFASKFFEFLVMCFAASGLFTGIFIIIEAVKQGMAGTLF